MLDAFSEPTFRKVLGKYVEEGPKHIILDLSQIDFVDSSGIGALVHLKKQTETNGGTSQIVTNARVTALGTTKNLDAHYRTRTRVVGHI